MKIASVNKQSGQWWRVTFEGQPLGSYLDVYNGERQIACFTHWQDKWGIGRSRTVSTRTARSVAAIAAIAAIAENNGDGPRRDLTLAPHVKTCVQ